MAQTRKKVILLPLDERPCNYDFPAMLMGADNPEYELVRPQRSLLGNKKTPASFDDVRSFLLAHCADAALAVVSMDTLLYGGLLPGRVHSIPEEELCSRLGILSEMKACNPALKIYAFHLIMRCPQYTSDEEEPDYYGRCGREIFLLGETEHRRELGLVGEEAEESIAALSRATAGVLGDYLGRRAVNLRMNCRVVDCLGESVDFLVIPQDDSSVYGYVAKDQQVVRAHVRSRGKQSRVLIYPGADEVGMTMLARAVAEDKGVTPKISAYFSATRAPFMIPKYEDRMLGESVKSQISAVGGMESEEREADIVLAVNAPADGMLEADEQERAGREYHVDRNLPLYAARAAKLVGEGRLVAVADVAFGNGGDLELAAMLDRLGIAERVAAYSGWNTSGNSLGTALAQAVFALLFGFGAAHAEFLALRYYEDVGFCACARKAVANTALGEYGVDYKNLGRFEKEVSARVAGATEDALRRTMPSMASAYRITACAMPWNRMFEVGLKVDVRR